MFSAVYKDSRDPDESGIKEFCSTESEALDAINQYFKLAPDSWKHCEYWAIVRDSDGEQLIKGKIFPGELK